MFINHCNDHQIEIPEKIKSECETIMESEEINEKVIKAIVKVGKNEEVKTLMIENEKYLHIPHSSQFFWTQAKRIFNDNFVPTKEDIILSKLKTFGISEMNFEMDEECFTMIDVGGQRSERRKWYHCFDNIAAVIYFVAVSEYDGQVLEEDNETDRFIESINLFKRLSGSDFFKNTPFILFLNKIDLLEQKLEHTPLETNNLFKDYNDYKENLKDKPKPEIDIALSYLEEFFERNYEGDDDFYPFSTCSIDEKQVEKVFSAVKSSVFVKFIGEMGI